MRLLKKKGKKVAINKILQTILVMLFSHGAIGQVPIIYDIQIIYSKKVKVESTASENLQLSDSVLIYFEEGFKNNEVELFINNEHFTKEKIETYENLGAAKSFNLGAVKEIYKVEFRIDGGKMVLIEPDNFHRIIAVNLIGNKLKIQFYEQLPIYD